MEKGLTKTTEQISLPESLKSLKPTLTALNDERQFAVILNSVPNSIERVLDCAPISTLVNAGAKRSNLEAVLAIEIARISKLLTVGGNLREGQSIEIAMQLIQDYPNESLEDFCLCLRRGVKGAYGEIFRFDILVIYEWFKKYLDEKYVVAENKLKDEKDDLYKPFKITETEKAQVNDKVWQEGLNKLKEAVGLMDSRKVPPLTDKDVLKEGQVKPAYQKLYVPEDPNQRAMKDKIKEVAAEGYRHLNLSEISNFKTFKIDGYDILAASEEDAKIIYEEAKSRR